MEHVLKARVSALGAAALASVALFSGVTLARASDHGPRWECAAEDEVVVIDHTCRHIDELVTP